MATKLDINFTQASDAIRNLARLFKHMEGAADALESIGSLDQAKVEKLKALAEFDTKLAAVCAENAALAGEQKQVKAQITQALAAAKSEADAIVAGANAKAAAIKTDAEVLAQARALQAAEDAGKIVAAAKRDAGKLNTDHAAAVAELAEIDSQVEAKALELKQVNDAITAARATMAKIMGQ